MKALPFSDDLLDEIAAQHGTPIYVYDERGILDRAAQLQTAFGSWALEYRNYFAVKATPTPAVLRVLRSAGMGFDCSCDAELEMLERFGLVDAPLFFTSNNSPDEAYARAAAHNAVINLDKAPYLAQVRRTLPGPPRSMAIRYNPGKVALGGEIIGFPAKAKFGATADDVKSAITEMNRWGVSKVGLHAMIFSNETQPDIFATGALALRRLAEQVLDAGEDLSFINVGGGLGVRYRPDEPEVDLGAISDAIKGYLEPLGLPVVSENGRFITGPNGYLVTRVTHGVQHAHEPFLQVDTSINNIARLATVTAAYHHLDVVGRHAEDRVPMNVTGSMCANTDVMFRSHKDDGSVNYTLPINTSPGDLLVIHDTGAHCRANSHNYNSKLRCGEVLVRVDGSHELIRRHETIDDLLTTLSGL